jgi:hypothetical protein
VLNRIVPTFQTPVEILENCPYDAVIVSIVVFPTARVPALRYFMKEDPMN